MKFVHLADVHLDMPFTSLKNQKELVKRRRLEQKFVFRKAIDLVKEENADALLIAGDLFEDKFVEEDTITYVISCLKELENTKVYITPGNHDPLIKSSPYNMYDWPENVFIFGSEVGMDAIDDDTDIYGIGFDDFEMESSAIKEIEVDSSKANLLITHGTLDGSSHKYHDIKSSWLTNFDYVALGHIHQPKVDDSRIIYPGSLVACGFDEPGEHGLVIGEVDKKRLKIQFIPLDMTQFEEKILDISNDFSPNEVLDHLKLKDYFYKIILTGVRNVDMQTLKEMIMISNPNVCEVIDKTRLDYDLETIAAQKTLKGIFTQKMLELLKDSPEQEDRILKAIEYVYSNMK